MTLLTISCVGRHQTGNAGDQLTRTLLPQRQTTQTSLSLTGFSSESSGTDWKSSLFTDASQQMPLLE